MAGVYWTPSPSFPQPATTPDPDAIPIEKWSAGEDSILQVLNCVYPTLDSEEKRKDVIEFMQRLIRTSVGVEVFPYGSVPLKTYLPDGDIDFTAIGTPDRGSVPRDVLHLLQAEERKANNEFEVKDVTFIDAEVKLVKCIVSGIVVDVSFNQFGGLCALSFLEKVDRYIGNDHLFKRSIILIKTWCYYESRILGATYGLISTYALAVLVLFIFHVFGASITIPLMALYRFLRFYGEFDWDNYCISLNGLVKRSSLPYKVVVIPVNEMTGAFISDGFLQECMDSFILRPKEPETNAPSFVWKYLNIIDPLKETNNLGRSVQLANSYRILSALRYGARTLGQVLELQNENIGDGIKKFFVNTLQRHKPKCTLDVPLMFDTLSLSSLNEAEAEAEAEYIDDVDSKLSNSDLGVYYSGTDDVSYVGSTEVSDLDVCQDLSLETTDEVANGGGGHGDLADDFLVELPNPDVIGEFGETESLNSFADLTGDYESNLRSLLYGQRYYGYAKTASQNMDNRRQQAYEAAPVPAHPNPAPGWYHPNSPPSPQVNPNVVVYPNGQTTTQTSQHFRSEERNPVRRTAMYIPMTNNFTAGPGRFPCIPIYRPQERARVQSGARRQAYSQRRLVFGTFGPIKPVITGSSSQGPPPNYAACGLSQGSGQAEKMFLKNEEEFPPLAA